VATDDDAEQLLGAAVTALRLGADERALLTKTL
jgi:hypothetical protein